MRAEFAAGNYNSWSYSKIFLFSEKGVKKYLKGVILKVHFFGRRFLILFTVFLRKSA